MSVCRGKHCGRTVLWAMGPNRKLMILDPEPDPAGNVVMTGERTAGITGTVPCVRVLAKNYQPALGEPELPAERYVPHHATCPDADQFTETARQRGRAGRRE